MTNVAKGKLNIEPSDNTAHIIGVDLAKDSFKASLKGKVRSFPNSSEGINDMIAWAKSTGAQRLIVAYESTGAVSHPYTIEMLRRGIEWVCLLPPAVKGYAKSMGKQVKNDKIDARIIEAYAEHLRSSGNLHFNPYVTEEILNLQEIESTIDQIKKQITSVRNSLQTKQTTHAKRCCENILKMLINEVEELIKESMRIINANAELKARYELYKDEPCVGKETARYLVVYMPELGHYKSAQMAALVGVVPIEKSSGKMDLQRHIGTGRRHVRRMLYAAAVSVYRCKSGQLKEFKNRLTAKRKPAKHIITSCVHKLVRIINGKTIKLMKGEPITPWEPIEQGP